MSSLAPIFDATLADAPVNIWQASSIFPRPVTNSDLILRDLEAAGVPKADQFDALVTVQKLGLPPLQPAFTDWTAITRGATT